MTDLARILHPVEAGAIPEYPLTGSERLKSHWFMTWDRQRWLNSGMRLQGTPECRAHYFDLINIAFDHSPLGTLPSDPTLLARMLMVDPTHFRALCSLPFGPLHQWTPCRCGDEVRLMHPVVLETIIEAISRREDNRAKTDAANAAKRLQRLRSRLATWSVEIASNDTAVRWIDRWLEDQNAERRTDALVKRAMGAWAEHVQAAGLRRSGR